MEIWQKHYVGKYTGNVKKITEEERIWLLLVQLKLLRSSGRLTKRLKEITEVSNCHNHGQTFHKRDTPYSYIPSSVNKYSSQWEVKAWES